MVPLLVLGGSILVFDLDHVRVLRNHGIVGVLIGSLPKAPQQNVFLGLPLQLSIYEAVWAVQAEIAVLVDGLRYNEKLAQTERFPAVVLVLEKVQYAATPDTLRVPAGFDVAPYVILPAEYIHRFCSPVSEIAPSEAQIDSQSALEKQSLVVAKTREFWHNYHAFKYLRELQYYMMPGLRFGGAFVAYPGDPLKFHSHLIVRVLRAEEKIDLLKIVTSGRLATAVKKAWLLIAEKDEKDRNSDSSISETPGMHAFSIEWAGFG